MKNALPKPEQRKQSLEIHAQLFTRIDYDKMRLQQKQYIKNLLATNRMLLKDFKIDQLILF